MAGIEITREDMRAPDCGGHRARMRSTCGATNVGAGLVRRRACCNAWNVFADDPVRLTSITSRPWPQVKL